MGTSQSSPGPGGKSPLVPPWADDQPAQSPQEPEARRFAPFRGKLGQAISSGNRSDLKSALGHYSRKASGGSSNAARRMGSVTKTGGSLFGVLSGNLADVPPDAAINIDSLSGLSCDHAISEISHALAPDDGDGDRIRVAINYALAEALDGIETFNPESITDEIIIDTMLNYLSESIFLQITMDAGKAWNWADTPSQAIRLESDLKELVRVVVDQHMGSRLSDDIRSFSRSEMIQVERQAIIDVWKEWEAYQ